MKPILGILSNESNLRRNSYLKRGGCNNFSGKRIVSHPLSIWTDDDIWNYIRRYDVPYCDIYNTTGISQTGCAFCGFGCTFKNDRRFEILYELYPKFYANCMGYQNSGYTYRYALKMLGLTLPDKKIPFSIF